MSIKKENISSAQFIFIIISFIQGSILLMAYLFGIAKHDSWLVILTGFAVSVPFALIYASIIKRFPHMNLVRIHDAVYGKYIGRTVSILYFLLFLMILSFNAKSLGDFFTTFFNPEIPIELVNLLFLSVCAFAISKGVEVIARISHIFVVIYFLVIISTFLMLIKNMNFSNFLPVFSIPIKTLIQGTHIVAAIPFGEIIIFLTFIPVLNNTQHLSKNILLALLMAAISFLISIIRDTAVLGINQAVVQSPSFQSLQLIEAANIFSKMDILIGIILITNLFIKCCVFYYGTLMTISQILSLKSHLTLLLPIGGIALILGLINVPSIVIAIKLTPSVSPIFVTPFIFIFPPLTLLIAKIRNLPKRKRG